MSTLILIIANVCILKIPGSTTIQTPGGSLGSRLVAGGSSIVERGFEGSRLVDRGASITESSEGSQSSSSTWT